MSDSDFIREVDEEMRRDQLKKLWDRFGIYIIGAAVLIVAVTAGYRGWQAWQESQSRAAGDKYTAAINLALEDKHEEAATALLALTADTTGGYPVLARIRAATETAAAGDVKGAVTAFESIANDSSVDQLYRDLATIRSGYLAVDDAPLDEITRKVEPLAGAGGTWRHSAREIMGLATWKAEDYGAAEKWFDRIANDTEAPATVKSRAQMLLSLIRAHLPAKGDAEPADEGATN